MVKFTFTSESVSEGHPDKVCDAISDAILDEYLKQDPNSRVACETLATTGTVFVSGEITSTATVDVENTVKKTLGDIGYNDSAYGMDYKNVNIIQKFFLGEAKLTKKSNIFTTVVLMYFRLFLPNDLFRGQIEG